MEYAWIKKIEGYLKGFFLYDMIEGINAEKRCLDDLFVLGVFGKEIGFPGVFNFYYLKLTPYMIGRLGPWKRRVLREKDFFDKIKD